MTPIGETLRRERLHRKLSFSDITRQTRISPRMLEAIEANQFDRLPGQIYANSFIRQYARTLGLDETEIIGAFQRQCADHPAASAERASKRPSANAQLSALLDYIRPWLRRYSWLGLSFWLLVTLTAGAFVYRMKARDERHPTSVSMVAVAPKTVAPKAVAPVVTPTEVKPVLNVQESGPAPPILVAFKASEPVWLSVKSDGTPAYTGTLESEQTREFDASSKMTVVVGNAGGLAVSLNGKPVGRIGDHGEVRVLQLTPEGARVVVGRRPVDPPATSDDAH